MNGQMKEETTPLEDMQHKISELEHLVKTLEQKNLEQEQISSFVQNYL